MLPAAYGFPAAVVLIIGGAIACFAGYRFFRVVLAIYGFILGALMASSMMGVGNGVGMIVAALIGASLAMVVQRYVIIVGTAFGGAWTMIVGLTNALSTKGITRLSSATEVWILYPQSTGERWAPIAWLILGVIGVAVQLGITSGKRR